MIMRFMTAIASATRSSAARRTRSLFCLTALSLAAFSVAAWAAGPFDGQWKGGSHGQAKTLSDKCSTNLDITLTIADGVVTGTATGLASHPITGKVTPDGAFTGTLSGGGFTGTFSGSTFNGEFQTGAGGCRTRAVQLQRAG